MVNRTSWILGFTALLSFVLLIGVGTGPAQGEVTIAEFDNNRLDMFVHTAGRLQALDNNDADGPEETFQHAIGNIGFSFKSGDYAEIYFDATQASRTHNEKWWGHEGYVIGKYFPEGSGFTFMNPVMETIDIKAGHMVLDFGDAVHRRSLNADVQRNPLIGNSVVSPHSTEAGLEIIHETDRMKVVGGISSGVPTDEFNEQSDLAYHAKIKSQLTDQVSLSGSYYTVSHDGGEDTASSVGAKSNMFSTDRLGEAYAGVNLGDDGQIFPGVGNDVAAWQVDLSYEPSEKMAIHAFYGNVEQDSDPTWRGGFPASNHPGESEWNYYSAEASYKFAPAWQAAARYSVADADKIGGNSNEDGEIDRLQVGVNAWMTERMLFKLEYVDQGADGFSSAYSNDAGFDGALTEVSYSF